MSGQVISDDDLLVRIASGDREAYACLMHRHGRLMAMVAERTTGNAADADEIVQEAFIKVWLQAWQWNPKGGAKFGTWLYRIVLNASLDRCRRKRPQSLDEIDDPIDPALGAYEEVMVRQRHTMIVAAMDDLSAKQREALILHYFGELTALNAAQVLGVSLTSLEALLFRGKSALRKALKRRGISSLGELL